MSVIATAGHVDHGKSTLVQALTGTDPDRLEEEQRRGLTIDLGFAHTTLPSGRALSIVDVPGHVRFLGNMLAGVGGVSATLFVVSAVEGWKPQSEEHLRILQLLGIEAGVIALTMIDLVDDDLLELAQLDVAEHVAGTMLADAPVVAVAAPVGEGIDELRTAIDRVVADASPAADRDRPRLWVDRAFAATGSGTVVTGTLAGGPLRAEQSVAVAPAGHTARIRGLQSAGRQLDSVEPGERVAVNLTGVGVAEVGRGDALGEPDRGLLSDRFDASMHVLASLDHEVSRRGAYVAYVGSGSFPASVRVLGTDALAPGTTGALRVYLDVAVPLLPGDRYILRETGRSETIGGGEVLDIAPVTRAADAVPDRSIERVVRERGWVDVDELELLTGERVEAVLGRWVVTDDELEQVRREVDALVDDAGAIGVDLAALDERQRATAEARDDIVIDGGRVRRAGAVDPFDDHPLLAVLAAGGLQPPAPDGVSRDELRELIRRGSVFERDGVYFHASAIDRAADVARQLLTEHTDGFTVAQFRDATGTSRKYALPILGQLDADGRTRRRDDLRIAGPRLG
ncbi:MAG: selenocysteine-specific translation elongation factor [Actinomycetota bacterium]